MSADIDFDSSDLLNLLLHNDRTSQSAMDDDSTAAQDWSKFSTLWEDHTDQSSLGMDMNFDPYMTIEPSVLHYPFTFQSALAVSSEPMSASTKSSSPSSAASSPPPSTPTTSLGSPTLNSISAVPATALPRPKTSHTTIERRYRTNLNARIQSLRMAVPALRVLEDRDGGKKIKKNVKGSVVVKGSGIGIIENDDGSVIDVIDERGFVDGVKVARKCSKANVLGKAVEYIRVLKKREHRLRAEQAGLKTLICSLVGGPALVKEWEREWKAKYGGEEQDEVGEEEGDEEDSEDEDGEEGEEDSGRRRKRPKTSPALKTSGGQATKKPAVPVVVGNDQVPEKRKRGRPRKVLPSTVSVASRATASSDHQILPTKQDETMHSFSSETQWVQHQQHQPQQFLLAVFALFSFFDSPLRSSSVNHNHSHAGTVLNTPSANTIAPTWSWKDYVQMFHLLVSMIVLVSFVRSLFGVNFGFGLKKTISVRAYLRDKIIHRQGAVDWVKMGEQSVAEGKSTFLSLYERVQIYRSVSRKNDISVGDLVTLALIARGTGGILSGLGRMKARSIWSTAQDRTNRTHPKRPISVRIHERLVFETLTVDEALDRLAHLSVSDTLTKRRGDGDGRIYTPLELLGCSIVKERAKTHVGKLFVHVVGKRAIVNDEEEREEDSRRMTVDAARELGGYVERLGETFERVWKTAYVEDDDLSYFANLEDDETKALFTALVLYRRVFAADLCGPSSTLLSPPPSPTLNGSVKHVQRLLELRKALGNAVFEHADVRGEDEDMDGGYDFPRCFGLEDARDRVVDMIVDMERRGRGISPDTRY